jgi:hypothetical protein
MGKKHCLAQAAPVADAISRAAVTEIIRAHRLSAIGRLAGGVTAGVWRILSLDMDCAQFHVEADSYENESASARVTLLSASSLA